MSPRRRPLDRRGRAAASAPNRSSPMRLAACLALLMTVAAAGAADDAAAGMDPAKMAAAMEKMSKTGAEHEALKKAVGTWDVATTMWMAPGAPPMTSKGSATFTSVLNGKWIQ